MLELTLLVIEEFCDVDSRQVYDEDNKGWKAVSNAIKGRLVADDDQFSLSLCLLAQRSPEKVCHIYVLPVQDAEDFFFMRSDHFPFSPLTFGYIGTANYAVTSGYKPSSKPCASIRSSRMNTPALDSCEMCKYPTIPPTGGRKRQSPLRHPPRRKRPAPAPASEPEQ